MTARVATMGNDWEETLGAEGEELSEAYDQAASDALYQDHPRPTPPNGPIDPGDDEADLPLDEG